MRQLYNKCTNLSTCSEVADSNILNAGKIYNIKRWVPPQIGWIRYNTEASKSITVQFMVISYVNRDNTWRVIQTTSHPA